MKLANVAAAACAVLGGAANAQTGPLNNSPDQWNSDLTFYLFLPTNTTGTSTVAGASVPIDLDLGDAIDLLDFAISGRYEAWKGDFGLIADANYLSLGTSGSPGPGNGSVSVDVTQYWLGFLGGYRVASGPDFSFDVQGGLRYNSLKQTVDISGPGAGMSLGGTETWWEPVIGARYLWQISDRWTGGIMVDAGGFGVGGNDLAFSATLGADLATRGNGSWKFGLRYYSIDYSTNRSDGPFEYDIDQFGPFVGYTFRF